MKYFIRENTRVRILRDVEHFIREWRLFRNLSVDQLAKRCGLSASMISQLERGKAAYTQNSLESIAKALECEPWQLLACGQPQALSELWSLAFSLDQPAMKKVLLDYENERFKEDEKRQRLTKTS